MAWCARTMDRLQCIAQSACFCVRHWQQLCIQGKVAMVAVCNHAAATATIFRCCTPADCSSWVCLKRSACKAQCLQEALACWLGCSNSWWKITSSFCGASGQDTMPNCWCHVRAWPHCVPYFHVLLTCRLPAAALHPPLQATVAGVSCFLTQ
jgi:hypothetical protein